MIKTYLILDSKTGFTGSKFYFIRPFVTVTYKEISKMSATTYLIFNFKICKNFSAARRHHQLSIKKILERKLHVHKYEYIFMAAIPMCHELTLKTLN